MSISFADCVIDLDRVEIRRSGELVPVRPQVFDVVEYLIRHRDRVVTRDELLDEIWGTRHVAESTVASCIKACRRALGDDGAKQEVIRTVQGRGFRFVAAIDGSEAAAEPAANGPDQRVHVPIPTSVPEEVETAPWPFVGRSDELERIESWYEIGAVAGVRIRGSEGMGVSSLGRQSARRFTHRSVPVYTIVGSPSARPVAFAAVRPLIGDVLVGETPSGASALTESAAFLAALGAARDRLPAGAVVVVDELADLDAYSAALLRHVIAERLAFVVVLERRGASGSPFGDVADHLAELALEPLSPADLHALLYRALAGPIDRVAFDRIAAVSGGRPGLVRDVVESSRRAGVLVREGGVWTFVGEPTSSTSASVPEGLSSEAVDALERLALAGVLPLSVLVSMSGGSAVDELDEHDLLAIVDDDPEPTIRLVDPLLVPQVVDTIGPLRTRRLRRELADHLLDREGSPRSLAVALGWAADVGVNVDTEQLVRAAQTAMIEADLATAAQLVEHAGTTDDPNLQLIDAEVSLQRNQWERAEQAFSRIDLDRLDETSRAHVMRRRASIDFYRHGRHDETVTRLRELADRHGGRVARGLLARRSGMLAYLGRASDVLAEADDEAARAGVTGIEVVLATGAALLHRGDFDRALDLVDEADGRIAELPDVFVAEPRDGATAIRCSALLQLGRIDEASDEIRRILPIGARTSLGYLPSLAARVERACGRPRAAREMLRQAIATSHRDEFPQYLVVAEANQTLAEIDLGHLDAAGPGVERTAEGLGTLSGELAWQAVVALHEMRRAGGVPFDVPPIVGFAEEARRFGAHAREADLLFASVVFDPAAGGAVLERLDTLASGLPGRLWPIRRRHAHALVEGSVPESIREDYLAIGFVGLAL